MGTIGSNVNQILRVGHEVVYRHCQLGDGGIHSSHSYQLSITPLPKDGFMPMRWRASVVAMPEDE